MDTEGAVVAGTRTDGTVTCTLGDPVDVEGERARWVRVELGGAR